MRERAQRGISLFAKGRYLRAKEEFEKILEADPQNEIGLLYTGMSHYELGNLEQALEYFKKILTLDKNFTACYVLLGLISAEQWMHSEDRRKEHNLREAISYCEYACHLNPDDKDTREFLNMLTISAS